MSEPLALHTSDAVELAHAWTQSLASSLGVRALLIKGPSLAHHGLREARTSADVDVLVPPDDRARLANAMARAGWRQREGTFASERHTTHSITFIADGWPCDVDVHLHYPGFLADPSTVFDILWDRRATMDLAHVRCDVPDRLSGILILALHSVRSTATLDRHADELAWLLDNVALDDADRHDLGLLAAATGSDQTLADVLPRLGVSVAGSSRSSPELDEWRRRVGSGASPTYMWFALFRRAGWRERAAIVRHAVWPTTRDLRIMYPDLRDDRQAHRSARLRRLARGIRALPGVVVVAVTAKARPESIHGRRGRRPY